MCGVYRKGILFGDHFLYRGMLLPTSRDQHDGKLNFARDGDTLTKASCDALSGLIPPLKMKRYMS